MTCAYCQFANGEEDHRCGRCGRRLTGFAVAAPAQQAREHVRIAVRALGANALAVTAVSDAAPPGSPKSMGTFRGPEVSPEAAASRDGLSRMPTARAAQPSLFGAELQPKIIPFQPITRGLAAVQDSSTAQTATAIALAPAPARPVAVPYERKPAGRTTYKKNPLPESSQATLDFLPPMKTAGRTLKTSAEAVIFCDAAAAAPIHRATASALDLSMILTAFGGVLLLFLTVGKPGPFDRHTYVSLGAMLSMVALLYGLIFAGFGAVTPGMEWTHLRLITFDGFPLDGRARALRFLGSWMSVLSGGIGLLWALLDEENLTWHDHMSKTFPTLRESDSNVVRQPRW